MKKTDNNLDELNEMKTDLVNKLKVNLDNITTLDFIDAARTIRKHDKSKSFSETLTELSKELGFKSYDGLRKHLYTANLNDVAS